MLKKTGLVLVALIVIFAAILTFGPREPIDETISFDAATIGSDIDAYLSAGEANIGNLTAGAQKQVVWNNPATKQKTPISIVYIHGFSATLEETRPMPDIVAKALGANLYFARLRGHGRDGDGLAEPSVNDWFNDTAEAIAIGRAIGDKVVVLSASTGGTFSTWIATKPELTKDIAGMVMVSPNFGINNPAAFALTLGAGRTWIPLLFGVERSFQASNAEHGKWWTSTYPTVALLPMAASVKFVNTLPFEDVTVPALFIYHPDDKVVRSDISAAIAARWGANTQTKASIYEVKESEDDHNHVIAGRILSPKNSQPLAEQAIKWIENL